MTQPFDDISDDKIIFLLNQGNKDAWEYVYDKYSTCLYGKLFRMTSSKELAEKILLQVFTGYKKNAVILKKRATLFITLFSYVHEFALKFTEPTADMHINSAATEAFPTINKIFFTIPSGINKKTYNADKKIDLGQQLRIELNKFRNSIL